jgi:hypothetical protein
MNSDESLSMKTNEALVGALRRAAGEELPGLVRRVAELDGGSLKDLEGAVPQVIFQVGRRWLDAVLAWRRAQEPAAARRQGTCGHRQRLVGWRPKQLVTLLGSVTWWRP